MTQFAISERFEHERTTTGSVAVTAYLDVSANGVPTRSIRVTSVRATTSSPKLPPRALLSEVLAAAHHVAVGIKIGAPYAESIEGSHLLAIEESYERAWRDGVTMAHGIARRAGVV